MLSGNATRPLFIEFEPRETKGTLHLPQGTPAPTAFLIAHRTKSFLNHIAARELAARGFTTLCINPRSDNNEALVDFEANALDVRQGMEFLRQEAGARNVVLIGHSGGGPTMSFYQAVAEKGPDIFRGDGRLVECPSAHTGLTPADGLILLDAHPGNPVNVLRSLNPAVVDEEEPDDVDPDLDPFAEENGYNPDGLSTYTEEFMRRYFEAQSERMNALIDEALALREELRSDDYFPEDDEVFVAYRASARLSDFSMSVAAGTHAPARLLRNDGSIDDSGLVRSVRTAELGHRAKDRTLQGGLVRTVNSFLSANAIRSTSSQEGIDWNSSNNSVPGALPHVTVPLLIAAMQAHYFIRDAELFNEVAASADKDFIVLEGADHFARPCPKAAKATGADYSNATRNMFDYVAGWASSRFR